MKYIIELEKIAGTDLYRAKGCNTLVFDENGIKNILTPYEGVNEEVTYLDLNEDDIFMTKNGKALYQFKGLTKNLDRINAINVENGKFVCMPSSGKFVRVKQ